MSGGRYGRVLLASAIALSVGCVTRTAPSPAAVVGPQLSVERFLRAANSRDLDSMGRLFGTANGPLGETGGTLGCAFRKIGSWFGGDSCVKKSEVEIRMDAIASILRHEDYTIVREEGVAGRTRPTTRILVDMRVRGRAVSSVPFVVVHTTEGRWLVQEIDLARVMAEAP